MSHVIIEDLADKISLLIKSERTAIRHTNDLVFAMNIGKDWVSRLIAGNRRLTEDKFLLLCKAFGTPQATWFMPTVQFGIELGFSRYQINQITKKYVPGIDFGSRIKDPNIVQQTYETMRGYWESFYFSVSKFDRVVVSRDYLIVKKVNEDLYIECEIIDRNVIYAGWCFPIKGLLYFMLEKEKILNEILFYCTNLPERQPPRLLGTISCVSGGVDTIGAKPAAAKCAFRYLGRDADVRNKYKLADDVNVREYLIQKNIDEDYYVDPAAPDLDSETKAIFASISNVVAPAAIPSALVVL